MTELWQAYGNWVLVAVFFIVMIGHHFFMGHGAHGASASHGNHDQEPGEGERPAQQPRPRRAGGCH